MFSTSSEAFNDVHLQTAGKYFVKELFFKFSGQLRAKLVWEHHRHFKAFDSHSLDHLKSSLNDYLGTGKYKIFGKKSKFTWNFQFDEASHRIQCWWKIITSGKNVLNT